VISTIKKSHRTLLFPKLYTFLKTTEVEKKLYHEDFKKHVQILKSSHILVLIFT